MDLNTLEATIAGDVVLPGATDYDAARKPAIARFHDVEPQAIVRCRTPEDVAEAIALARRRGLATATRSGGHCFAGKSTTSGIVIDVGPMSSVSVQDGVATVGAGTRLGDLYDALDEHGLTIPAGCGPPVGVAGLVLGGGLGILGRKHGLTSDNLLAAQVVLANGSVVDCDADRDGELFWALRGAGAGNFGVATSFVFDTLPAPAATVFRLVWPFAHATTLIGAWQDWSPSAPDELAASLLVTVAGDAHREPAVSLFGAMIGGKRETEELLGDFVARVEADPGSAFTRALPYRAAKRLLSEPGDDEPADDGHLFSKSEFFRRPLPADAIAALVAGLAEGRAAGEWRQLDFSPWGGAYNRVAADATAFVHRDERFLLKHAVVVDPDADTKGPRRWLTRSWETVHPYGSRGVYPNFPDPELDDPARAYYGTNLERLIRVKRRYDPDDFFRFPQSLPVE
jgi:FAD/FMN-containing dehydrogenase